MSHAGQAGLRRPITKDRDGVDFLVIFSTMKDSRLSADAIFLNHDSSLAKVRANSRKFLEYSKAHIFNLAIESRASAYKLDKIKQHQGQRMVFWHQGLLIDFA